MLLTLYLYSAISYICACICGYSMFCIFRLTYSKKSLTENNNYCDTCQTRIPMWKTYPIVGYILSLGKCNACGKPISITMFILEIMTFLIPLAILYANLNNTLTGLTITLTLGTILFSYYLSVVKFKYEMELQKSEDDSETF